LFCHHDKSVTVRLDRKEGLAQLVCRVCDQRYQSKVNRTLISPLPITWTFHIVYSFRPD
jgi:transcription elongation factor Elf1